MGTKANLKVYPWKSMEWFRTRLCSRARARARARAKVAIAAELHQEAHLVKEERSKDGGLGLAVSVTGNTWM